MSTHRYRRLLGRRPAREVDAELQIHFDMMVDDYVARGMTRDDARRAAEAQIGDTSAARAEVIEIDTRLVRRERLVTIWQALIQDTQLAFRMFAREKAWTGLAVLTLGVGVGANSALFSIVHAALIRPLPYVDPDGIVSISTPSGGVDDGNATDLAFDAWKAQSKTFSILAGARWTQGLLRREGRPEYVVGRRVTQGYFSVFGVKPILGRVFTPDEMRVGAPPVIVLSEQVWRNFYRGDTTIVGRSIATGFDRTTVIGVMPASFSAGTNHGYWEPLVLHPWPGITIPISVVGRLAPGATVTAARAELGPILSTLHSAPSTVVAMSLHERRYGAARPALLMLFAAVGVLLLIAAANVANLLLARAARRNREFATRIAIGASASRLVRFLLTESLALGLMAAAVGVIIAQVVLGVFVHLSPPMIKAIEGISIDGSVMGFAIALGLLTSLVFGLGPVLHARKVDFAALLSDGARSYGVAHRTWLRRGLVITELATALVLLTGAGLLMKSFVKVITTPTGVDPERVLVVRPNVSGDALDRFVAGVSALPGIESVALADVAPFASVGPSFRIEPKNPRFPAWELDVSKVTPAYFHTTGVRLVSGRFFDARDLHASEPVAVLTEAAVRALGQGPVRVGERVYVGDPDLPEVRVVGIARDVLQRGVEAPAPGVMYVPMRSAGSDQATVLARVSGNPARFIPAIRDLHWGLDSLRPAPAIKPLERTISDAVAPRRFTFVLLTAFAVVGAILSVIGVYGVLSYVVAERTGEIGMRMALGADAGRIMRELIGEGMALVAIGLSLGLAVSLGAVRLLEALLFRMSPYDPLIFTAAAGLLAVTALLACAIPARRAAALDPVASINSG